MDRRSSLGRELYTPCTDTKQGIREKKQGGIVETVKDVAAEALRTAAQGAAAVVATRTVEGAQVVADQATKPAAERRRPKPTKKAAKKGGKKAAKKKAVKKPVKKSSKKKSKKKRI